MIRIKHIILLLVVLSSCRKGDSLPGFLVGKWQWKYSIVLEPQYNRYGNYTHSIIVDTLYPYSNKYMVNFNASFKIKRNGNVLLMKNETLLTRIKSCNFEYYGMEPDYYYRTGDYFDHFKKGYFSGLSLVGISHDILWTSDFPIDSETKTLNINEVSVIDEKIDSLTFVNFFEKK